MRLTSFIFNITLSQHEYIVGYSLVRDAVPRDIVFDGLEDCSTPHWNSCFYTCVCYDSLPGRTFRHNLLLKMLIKLPAHNVVHSLMLHLYRNQIRPKIQYCSHIQSGVMQTIISTLDRIQHYFHGKCSDGHTMLLYFSLYKIEREISTVIIPDLASRPRSYSHCRYLTFQKYVR